MAASMSPSTATARPPSKGQVASVVSFYMTAALVMVFVNKAVLNSSPDLPLLFLLFQLLLAVALLHGAALVFPRAVDLPNFSSDLATARTKLLPVITVNIVGLVFNTLCLRDVEASFFQIARGMVLPLTIFVSSLATKSAPTAKVLTAAAIVTLGFLLGVTPTSSLPATAAPSLLSLIYGFLSSLFIAVHSVLIKSSLPHCGGSTIKLAYWTNLGSAVMLFPFVLLHGEPWRVLELAASTGSGALEQWNSSVFIWGSIVTGIFGFLLCIAGLLSIKVTSPITHMFSSAARSVIQTLLGVWLFGDLLTVNRGVSILTILAGTMFYTWVKSVESSAPAQAQRPSVTKSISSMLPPSLSARLLSHDEMDDEDDLDALEAQLKHGSNNKGNNSRRLSTVLEMTTSHSSSSASSLTAADKEDFGAGASDVVFDMQEVEKRPGSGGGSRRL